MPFTPDEGHSFRVAPGEVRWAVSLSKAVVGSMFGSDAALCHEHAAGLCALMKRTAT